MPTGMMKGLGMYATAPYTAGGTRGPMLFQLPSERASADPVYKRRQPANGCKRNLR